MVLELLLSIHSDVAFTYFSIAHVQQRLNECVCDNDIF